MSSRACYLLVAASAVAVTGMSAMADLVSTGTYQLHNHPDGNQNPPLYGLRLDELYNVTSSNDVFTFDFDNAQSNMRLVYNGTTIHIFGTAFGGRDIGAAYANDVHRGVYTIDFTYSIGVGSAPGDDDLMVNPGIAYNYGTIIGPNGATHLMRDGHYGSGQPDFRLGNEDNDLGHRGFAGISGWGWIFHTLPGGTYTYYQSSDWLFTASLVPTPGSAALLGLGMIAAGRRRR